MLVVQVRLQDPAAAHQRQRCRRRNLNPDPHATLQVRGILRLNVRRAVLPPGAGKAEEDCGSQEEGLPRLYAVAGRRCRSLVVRTTRQGCGRDFKGNLRANNGDALVAAAVAGQGIIYQVARQIQPGLLVPIMLDRDPIELGGIYAVYHRSESLPPKSAQRSISWQNGSKGMCERLELPISLRWRVESRALSNRARLHLVRN